MINKIIAFSIRNKLIIAMMTLALIVAGIWAMFSVNLGSIPDITDNQVQVITVSQNLSTEDIEQFVTYPVELAMANLPGVKEIRSISRDRKSTRLNSSHVAISYAVFCLKKKKNNTNKI